MAPSRLTLTMEAWRLIVEAWRLTSEKLDTSPDLHQIDAYRQHCTSHTQHKILNFGGFFFGHFCQRLFLYLPQRRAILFGLLCVRCLRNSSLGRNSKSSKRVPVLRHSWRRAWKQCCGTVTIFYGSGSGSDF